MEDGREKEDVRRRQVSLSLSIEIHTTSIRQERAYRAFGIVRQKKRPARGVNEGKRQDEPTKEAEYRSLTRSENDGLAP